MNYVLTNHRNEKGFTLIELLVGLLLTALLIGGVGSVYVSSKVAYNIKEQSSRVQENIRYATFLMRQEISSAGDSDFIDVIDSFIHSGNGLFFNGDEVVSGVSSMSIERLPNPILATHVRITLDFILDDDVNQSVTFTVAIRSQVLKGLGLST